jgi:DNA-binding XRE family transcriptional regulator
MATYRDDKIRGRMAELELTVDEVAAKAGVSNKTVIAIRKGAHVSTMSLERVALALGLPMWAVYAPREETAAV